MLEAAADGKYGVGVSASRGEGGPAPAQRLTIRAPGRDLTVRFSPSAAAVFPGGAVPLRVSASRMDEFAGVIRLRLVNVPPGLQAAETTLPAGEKSTAFALYADPGAVVPAKGMPLKLEARALIDGKEVVGEVVGGLPGVSEAGDMVTRTEQAEVRLQGGGESKVTVGVERWKGLKGGIAREVLGLPAGVGVLEVGLKGMLIPPGEWVRRLVL